MDNCSLNELRNDKFVSYAKKRNPAEHVTGYDPRRAMANHQYDGLNYKPKQHFGGLGLGNRTSDNLVNTRKLQMEAARSFKE